MKACLCKSFGPPSNLVIEEMPDPVAGAGEVVVSVQACALNFFDTLIIQGRYQYKPDMPFSPSAEFAGVVEATGEGVGKVSVGDRVMGYMRWGAAREMVSVCEADLVHLPDAVSFEVAAGLAVTYGTTLHAFRDRAKLQAGETVAVLGASGGVGQAAVEIATVMGAKVIACASSEEKLGFARELGAELTIDYSTQPLKETLKELTGGDGVNVVYDPVGGDLSEQALRATAWEGRFLVIGFAAGDIPKIPLNIVMLKGCDVQGVFWGASVDRDPDAHRSNMEQVLKWVGEGKLKPHVHAVYPMEEISAALEEIAARRVRGKVIVKP
ncbi:MAG: NADPH:quinone oxidoreductase family protein [Roseibium sp.]|uniref:NADPH:quinone oxidoreductase family protein n=1 Tax=Roseibium sp. TaxID=1936156 RepID=UPI001B0DE898|nr:NADPH:quinone oxidoreductase family protein [Roseibium sp.]MBO6892111.1 NADPH:quinone oxidoreductase family protein [Roseibium sp.]MBO6930415.1 NADPH:quinone oxidoreductase family protein [Roseibium sp.]